MNEKHNNTYSETWGHAKHFPAPNRLQRFFGIRKKDLFHYLDKDHREPYLRAGYEWNSDIESLSEWWAKHDEKASKRSTAITKELAQQIQQDSTMTVSHQSTFRLAEKWLVLKEGSSSSRYYQVEAMRNNLYNHMMSNLISQSELDKISYEVKMETKYFAKHWQRESKAASLFKTKATKDLDKAFVAHAKVETPSRENDEQLLVALDKWIDIKNNSSKYSKRYDLFIRMREQLQETIEGHYGKKPAQDQNLTKKETSIASV